MNASGLWAREVGRMAGLEQPVLAMSINISRRRVTLTVDAADADANGDEPVWHNGEVVGWVTSGGYGHCVGRSIALAYVPQALAVAGHRFEVEILGERREAALAPHPLHNPAGSRMRHA